MDGYTVRPCAASPVRYRVMRDGHPAFYASGAAARRAAETSTSHNLPVTRQVWFGSGWVETPY